VCFLVQRALWTCTSCSTQPVPSFHHLLPPRSDAHYSLRPRAHDFTNSIRNTSLSDKHFINISLIYAECYIKTLVAFDNILIYVFHFNLTAILCISVLTVTFIKLLLPYLLISVFGLERPVRFSPISVGYKPINRLSG